MKPEIYKQNIFQNINKKTLIYLFIEGKTVIKIPYFYSDFYCILLLALQLNLNTNRLLFRNKVKPQINSKY